MFEPPEREQTFDPVKPKSRYADGCLPAKEQLREIAEIKPPSLADIRTKYLNPLYEKLSPPKSLDERLEEMGF